MCSAPLACSFGGFGFGFLSGLEVWRVEGLGFMV